MKLLILGSTILAASIRDFINDGSYIRCYNDNGNEDAIHPLQVIEGYVIVDVSVPSGFNPHGYTWDGTQLVAKITPPIKNVPLEVTMRQARQVLLKHNLLNTVNSIIAGLPGTAGDSARIEWEYSGRVERYRELVAALGQMIPLSKDELDDLFIEANTL